MESTCKQNSNDLEINDLIIKYKDLSNDSQKCERFSDLPLSQKTLNGLSCSNFIQLTNIQRDSIGWALQGKDVVGCAITGSGKTLAFLIPVLERLFISKWSNMDGIGAIIISPTRELAYQIFETLKKIGQFHDFSVGLIIGGKNLKFEKKRMDRCNILICTPGRLLQHMDENVLFNALNMQILVLDEADRCLDMGFEKTISAILENLPLDRQTLLFSATQTQSVKDLMRLNLKNVVKVGPKELDQKVPSLLQQNYVVVDLDQKITVLWSFIKNHLKQKCIIFLASCKQVKYVYEIFCKLHPGTSLLALYGTLHQDRRIAIYNEFLNKSNVYLFATDIASRGLDFPTINWVIQFDCPENVAQYIHRAGRCARNNRHGESLLVLTPSEEHAMIHELKKNFIDIKPIHIDPNKLFSPLAKIQAFLAQNPNLNASAKRAFLGYIKSVHSMQNKKIFDVLKINFDRFAQSLGLAVTPRIRFLDNKKNGILNKERNKVDIYQFEHEMNSDELFTIKKTHNNETEKEELEYTDHELRNRKQISKAGLIKKLLKKKIKINSLKNENSMKFLDFEDNMCSTEAQKDSYQHANEEIDFDVSKYLFAKNNGQKNNKKKKKDNNNMRKSKIFYDDDLKINSKRKHKTLGLTLNKKKDTECSEKKMPNVQTKKRKTESKTISLKDAESIVAEVLC